MRFARGIRWLGVLVFATCMQLHAAEQSTRASIASPGGVLSVVIGVDPDGRPQYTVARKGHLLIAESRLGFLPEESYLYRWLNADETLDFFGRLFNLDRETRKKRTDELIERFGLAHARKRQIREYS